MFELNRIYNMDCMEAMKSIPANFFDLAICDPPYGINAPGMSMGSNRSRTKEKGGYPHESTADRMRKERGPETWDTERPGPAYFRELFRISKNQVIFGYNYFSDLLPPTRCVIVWDKMQPWEAFSQAEIAWSSFDRPAILIKISNTGGSNATKKIHQTQKPVSLYETIIYKLSEPGQKIIDTHAGSGAMAVAANNTGRDWLAFEINPATFKDAAAWIEQERAQENIFSYERSMKQ